MECPSCSAEVRQEQRFCPSCGARLGGVSVPPRVVAPDVGAVTRLPPPTSSDDDLWRATVPEPPPPLTPIPAFAPPDAPTSRIEVVTRGGDTVEQPAIPRRPVRSAALTVAALVMMCAVGATSLIDQVHYDITGDRVESVSFALSDLFSSHLVATALAGLVILIGIIVLAAGHPLGAGLVGGVGLSVGAALAMAIGSANRVLDEAEVTVLSTPGSFTITVTRDLGYFLSIGAATLGLIVFLLSIRAHRSGRRRLWLVVPGLLGSLAVVVGTLLPEGAAGFADNFGVESVPPVASWMRLVALSAVLVAGLVGFLAGSRWGAAVVVGAIAVPMAQVVAAQVELDGVVDGFVGGNIGAGDALAHPFTLAGLGVMLLAGVVGLALTTRER